MKGELIGRRLRALRILAGFSYTDVEKRGGPDSGNLARMEKGVASVTLESALKLARAYNCTVEYLAEGCEP